ncbi:IS4 family transposase [Microcoleus sp. FACHB-672]|uniref:IS4 family transposase n=1 Tax=Microcoleus sp. FACHB-672 TaxID=2692825 RepID=UPI001689AE31|nr:IS4 family transposase [Microcoleus sp. FACHB-672]MBD2039652.1 IS4 family transposase [Microcoleus sp. FACHB-672]
MLLILINIIQSQKEVRLETIARVFPLWITFEGRRRKIQRFLDLPSLTVSRILWPIISYWLLNSMPKKPNQKLYLAIDRSQWKNINLLMVSVIWQRRAIPLAWRLLPHLGNSNFEEQESVPSPVLARFKDYQIVVLGNREFCSLDLASWLVASHVGVCLRLKKATCLEVENQIWQRLDELPIKPGISCYYQGRRIRKTRPVAGFSVAAKWKRNYRGQTAKEAWFILTNLGSLTVAIAAYKRRMGIEQMFRDCKRGGYNLERTGLRGERLNAMILVMSLAYLQSTLQGDEINRHQGKKYVCRSKESGRIYRRRSTLGIGLDAEQWVKNLEQYHPWAAELTSKSSHKRHFYQRGLRAQTIIRSIS